MTNIDKIANLGKSAAAKAMSASQFSKGATKAASSFRPQPERLTGTMDGLAAQNKANILEKMKLIQKLRNQGISTKNINSKTLDKIQQEIKNIETKTNPLPTDIPEREAAIKILDDPFGRKTHQKQLQKIQKQYQNSGFEPRIEPYSIGE